MTEPDPGVVNSAAREYHELRLWLGRVFTGSFVFVIAFALLYWLVKPSSEMLFGILVGFPILGFVICVAMSVRLHYVLMQIRCPRCEQQFTRPWSKGWPDKSCQHCGLHFP